MLKRRFANDIDDHARPAETGRRRGLATRLLLGWIAFWLAIAVQPCGISLAAQRQENSTVAPATLGAQDHQASVNLTHDPAPAGTHCPDLTVAAVIPSAVTALTDHLDSPRPVPPASDALIMRRVGSVLNSHDLLPAPPPHAPLYLRNQRLLI